MTATAPPMRPAAFVDPLPAVPAELKARPQWILWNPVERDGRTIKVPLSAIHPGKADTTNPTHWADYKTASAESQTRSGKGGLGFVFSMSDGFTGIDLDDCLDPETGAIQPWAKGIIDTLDSYAEVSPSGTGVKLWVKAKLPDGKGHRTKLGTGEIEVYDRARYFAVTGQHLAGTPITIEDRQSQVDGILSTLFLPRSDSDGSAAPSRGKPLVVPKPEPPDAETELLNVADDEALVKKAMRAANGEKFKGLWEGNHDSGSQSEADLALCDILAYWTDGDMRRVDRLFRQSALMRDKWNEKRGAQTYGEITVGKACAEHQRKRADASATDVGLPSLARWMAPRFDNDHGNAERFKEIYGRDVRFCYPLHSWFIWDGRRWAMDSGGQAYRLAKQSVVEALRQAIVASNSSAEKFSKLSLDDRRITALLRMAQSDLAVDPNTMDANPLLLNFEDGTVDLEAGLLRGHQREDYITKLAHCPYDVTAEAPTFMRVIERATSGSKPMLDYLQQVFGYALTGSTVEKAFFICYGPSGTGKTTILNAIRSAFSEYSTQVQIETLMARAGDLNNNMQSDLADLRGARFAQTSETEQGQRLKEGLIKRLTQGAGKIKAARKYQDHVVFSETHKLFLDANHRPEVRDGLGIWERLHCIAFTNVVPSAEQDTGVHTKLEDERAGIAAWVVQGARAWLQAGRLVKPLEVLRANEDYRASQDEMGDWVEDWCIIAADASVKCSDLLESYNQHTTSGGNSGRGLDARKFKERIMGRPGGIAYVRRSGVRLYTGIGLKSEFNAAV